MILTTSYENPDLDGVACAVGMAELLRAQGKDAQAVIFGTPSLEARWVSTTYAIPLPPDGKPLITPETPVILLDESDPKNVSYPAQQVVEIIDHREAHRAAEFPNATRVQIELVGSCATLVAERMRAAAVLPLRDTARLLTGAIISNTVNFRSPITTERDRAAAAWLAPIADLPPAFATDMFTAKSDLSGDRLREALLSDYTVKEFGGTRYVALQVEANGIAELFRTRREVFTAAMEEVRRVERCAFVFASGLDLTEGVTYFFADGAVSKRMLADALGVQCDDDGMAVLPTIMMRKQMHPKLKEILETS